MKKYEHFYKTHYGKNEQKFEAVKGEHETVEGEALSIAELLKREMNGIQGTRQNVFYMDNVDLDKITEFYRASHDLTDLETIINENKRIQKMLDSAIKAAEKKVKEEEIPQKDPKQKDMFEEDAEKEER